MYIALKCVMYHSEVWAVFTKHLKAKSSSQLADLGETRKINCHVSPNFRTHFIPEVFPQSFTAKTAPKRVKSWVQSRGLLSH